MAEENKKPALPPSAPESPTVKHLRARRVDLTEKLVRLGSMKSTEEHDIETAKTRTQNMINEVDAELKRLGAMTK